MFGVTGSPGWSVLAAAHDERIAGLGDVAHHERRRDLHVELLLARGDVVECLLERNEGGAGAGEDVAQEVVAEEAALVVGALRLGGARGDADRVGKRGVVGGGAGPRGERRGEERVVAVPGADSGLVPVDRAADLRERDAVEHVAVLQADIGEADLEADPAACGRDVTGAEVGAVRLALAVRGVAPADAMAPAAGVELELDRVRWVGGVEEDVGEELVARVEGERWGVEEVVLVETRSAAAAQGAVAGEHRVVGRFGVVPDRRVAVECGAPGRCVVEPDVVLGALGRARLDADAVPDRGAAVLGERDAVDRAARGEADGVRGDAEVDPCAGGREVAEAGAGGGVRLTPGDPVVPPEGAVLPVAVAVGVPLEHELGGRVVRVDPDGGDEDVAVADAERFVGDAEVVLVDAGAGAAHREVTGADGVGDPGVGGAFELCAAREGVVDEEVGGGGREGVGRGFDVVGGSEGSGDLRLEGGAFVGEGVESGALLGGGDLDDGRVRLGVAVHRVGVEVVEERVQRVVVALCDRVELVVVALRAADREAEEGGAGGVDAVGDVAEADLVEDRAAFVGGDVGAEEAGGDAIVEGGVREEVAGDLLDDERSNGTSALIARTTQSR